MSYPDITGVVDDKTDASGGKSTLKVKIYIRYLNKTRFSIPFTCLLRLP